MVYLIAVRNYEQGPLGYLNSRVYNMKIYLIDIVILPITFELKFSLKIQNINTSVGIMQTNKTYS